MLKDRPESISIHFSELPWRNVENKIILYFTDQDIKH